MFQNVFFSKILLIFKEFYGLQDDPKKYFKHI